jgi:hypothetical protein
MIRCGISDLLLQSLRLEDPSSSVEVYDRLGHISRFSRNTGYSDA